MCRSLLVRVWVGYIYIHVYMNSLQFSTRWFVVNCILLKMELVHNHNSIFMQVSFPKSLCLIITTVLSSLGIHWQDEKTRQEKNTSTAKEACFICFFWSCFCRCCYCCLCRCHTASVQSSNWGGTDTHCESRG